MISFLKVTSPQREWTESAPPGEQPNRSQPTLCVTSVNETPDPWGDKLLAVTVYGWDAAKGAWEEQPLAFSDRLVWGKGKAWQHTLRLVADKGSPRALAWSKGNPTLPPGKYLVKVSVDATGRLAKDWKAELGSDDVVGQIEINARWADGYGAMMVVDGRRVKR